MKLSFLFIFFTLVQVAATGFSQTINLDVSDAEIRQVIKSIEQQTDYRFFYTDGLTDLSRKVNLNMKGQNIDKVLSELLGDTQLGYRVIDNKLVMLAPREAMWQGIIITGTVTDNGMPLPGVNVVIKGTTSGVVTDVNGKYSINVPDGNTILTYSFVGYATAEFTVGDQRTIDIALGEDTREIQEVVVVGYGTQKKVNVTGSVAAVKVDDALTNRSLANVSSGLQGLLPGLAVSQNSGMAGRNNVNLLIRGMGTVNNTDPLVVVDGVPDVDINRINMSDIESISVLKDAASAAVYGSRAANGVILIMTKTGKGSEKTKVSLSASYSWDSPVKALEPISDYSRVLTLLQYRRYLDTADGNIAFKKGTVDQWMALSMVDPLNYPNTDWWDTIMRTGSNQKYDISATGSSDKANFYASIGLTDQKGLQVNNNYTMYTARFNFDYKVRHNMNIGMRFSGNWTKYTYYLEDGFTNEDGGGGQLTTALAGITPYDPITGYYGGVMNYGSDVSAQNPYFYMVNCLNRQNRQEVLPSVYIDWTPVKGLTARLDYSINYYNQFRYKANTPGQAYNFQTGSFIANVFAAENAPVQNWTETGYKTQMDGLLTYQTKIASNHDINIMAGYSEEYWYSRSQDASRNDRIHPTLHEIDAALTNTQSNAGKSWAEGLRSFFGRANYVAFDKYLLEVNLRADASSKFVSGHQWGFFPSASVGWRFTEENFIKPITGGWLNQGKVRISYGTMGNNDIVDKSNATADIYQQRETLSTQNYIFDDEVYTGFVNKKMINRNLTWETTAVTNIGLDLGFLDNRLTAELDYYDKLTTNMIRPSEMSTHLSSAYSAPRTNIGELRNRGVEANITWRDKKGDFSYMVNGNVSFNRSQLLKWNQFLSKGYVFVDMPYHFLYTYLDNGVTTTFQEFYDSTPMVAQLKRMGDIMWIDVNGDGRVDANDKVAYPNINRDRPSTNFALRGSVSWKGFDFAFMLQGAAGRKNVWLNNYNNPKGVNTPLAEHWYYGFIHGTGEWPNLGGENNHGNDMEFWLDNMAYLRVKNLQLGYSMPKKWLNVLFIDNLRVYATVENIATLTNWRGLDPESESNINTVYPLVKSFSIGINVGF